MDSTEQLLSLLRRCTMQITALGESGTGFFVAPGLLLTCAHVVENAQSSNATVAVKWGGQPYTARIERFFAKPYPDLALLRINNLPDHPCVYFHEEVHVDDNLSSYGYTDKYPDGDPATFVFEGPTNEPQLLLKFKFGEVRSGLSGGPLLNRRTGGVCGVVKRTRGVDSVMGGRAIPTSVVLQQLPELVSLQRQFHQQDRRWASYLTRQQRRKLGLVNATDPIEVFFSYHPKDKKQRDKLETHLAIMKRLKLINSWYDQDITAGKENAEEIYDHLNAADIILLLISADFLASESLYENEVERARERREKEGTWVIPILLRSVDGWNEMDLGKLQPLPRDRRPVNQWKDEDDAFAHIAAEIRRVVQELRRTS